MHLELGEIALLLFIGVGPVKSLAPFLDATRGLDRSRQIGKAVNVVLVVALLSVLLLALGRLLEHLFHFSEAALIVSAGLVLGILGMQMVLGSRRAEHGEGHIGTVVPLAVPLTLNPVGIAALILISGFTPELSDVAQVLLVLLGILLLDVLVFSIAALFPAPSSRAVTVVEIIFGVLVVALAVDVLGLGIQSFFTEHAE